LVVSSPWFKPPGGFVPDSPISETLMGLLELNHASISLAELNYHREETEGRRGYLYSIERSGGGSCENWRVK
jgi:hypothetical protein